MDIALRRNCTLLGYSVHPVGPIFMGQESKICPGKSLKIYHYTLRSIPEELSSHLLCGESMKAHIALDKYKNHHQFNVLIIK